MTTQADNAAEICGTEGYIEVPTPWKPPMAGRDVDDRARDAAAAGRAPGAAPTAPPRKTRTAVADRELYALEADDFAAAVFDGVPPRCPARS